MKVYSVDPILQRRLLLLVALLALGLGFSGCASTGPDDPHHGILAPLERLDDSIDHGIDHLQDKEYN